MIIESLLLLKLPIILLIIIVIISLVNVIYTDTAAGYYIKFTIIPLVLILLYVSIISINDIYGRPYTGEVIDVDLLAHRVVDIHGQEKKLELWITEKNSATSRLLSIPWSEEAEKSVQTLDGINGKYKGSVGMDIKKGNNKNIIGEHFDHLSIVLYKRTFQQPPRKAITKSQTLDSPTFINKQGKEIKINPDSKPMKDMPDWSDRTNEMAP